MNRKSFRVLVAICLSAVMLTGCATHQPLAASFNRLPAEQEIVWLRNQSYTPASATQALQGDWVRPVGSEPVPGLLMVHGGGWSRRSRDDMTASAERFAKAGFGVFNISHRFAPAFTYPSQLIDLQQATQWMRNHAAELGLDASWIAGYGYSSGGHLVALQGLLSADSPHYQADARLQALVLGGAPTDLRRFRGGTLVPQFLGTTIDRGFARYVEASPVTHLSADDPPTFVYHGGLDALVAADYAREFVEAATAVNVATELYISPLQGHVSMFLLRDDAEYQAIRFLLGQWQHRHAVPQSGP